MQPRGIRIRDVPFSSEGRPAGTGEIEDAMPDKTMKPSEVDAVPGSRSAKPTAAEPGAAPKASEADAQPNKPQSNERASR